MSGESSDLLKENKIKNKSSSANASESEGSAYLSPPAYQVTSEPVQRKPDDTVEGLFTGDEKIDTDSGIRDVNAPSFDPARMRTEMVDAHFEGAGDEDLRIAMTALQGRRLKDGTVQYPQGEALDKQLAVIARIRNLDPKKVQSDYQKMQQIKAAGERHGSEDGHDDVSPLLDVGKHPEFMGSTSQLRFGMTMGDVFGVDPVFGALISPTGGAVGPGNESVSDAPIDNATVLHGTVHDAAGYLKNAHGIGPGYNYLQEDWEMDTTNPLSGQASGIPYFLDAAPDQVNLSTVATARRLVKESKEAGGDLSFSDAMLHASIEVSEGNAEFDDYSWASGDLISKGLTGVADAGFKAKDAAVDAWDTTKGLASDAWDWTKEKGGQIKDGASDAWDWTKEKAGQGVDKVKGLGSDAWDWTKEKGGQIKDGASDAWDWSKDKASEGVDKAKGLGSDAWGWAKDKAGDLKESGSNMWGSVKDSASSGVKKAKGLGSDAWGWAKDKASDAKQAGSNMWGSVKDTASSGVKKAKGLGGDAWGWAKGKAGDAKQAGSNMWGSAKDSAKSAGSKAWGTTKGAASSAWSGAKKAGGKAAGAAKGAASSAWKSTKSMGSKAGKAASSGWKKFKGLF